MHRYTYHDSMRNLWNKRYNTFIKSVNTEILVKFGKNNLVWMLSMSLNDFPLLVLTWASYNLLISKEHTITSICTLPLANGSQTDFSNLYTALKIVQGISVVEAPGRKIIVSLDPQLYAECIHLSQNKTLGIITSSDLVSYMFYLWCSKQLKVHRRQWFRFSLYWKRDIWSSNCWTS